MLLQAADAPAAAASKPGRRPPAQSAAAATTARTAKSPATARQQCLPSRCGVKLIDVHRLHGPLDQPDVDKRLLRLELLVRRRVVLHRGQSPRDGLHAADERFHQRPAVRDTIVARLGGGEAELALLRLVVGVAAGLLSCRGGSRRLVSATARRRRLAPFLRLDLARAEEGGGDRGGHRVHLQVAGSRRRRRTRLLLLLLLLLQELLLLLYRRLLLLLQHDGLLLLLSMLGHQHRQLELGDGLELEHEDLHHAHEQVPRVALGLLLAPQPYALHEVQQKLTAHRLDARRQRLVVRVPREQLDGPGQVRVGQVLADVVHQVRQGGVGQRAQGLVRRPAPAQQDVLVEQVLHVRHELDPQLGGEDVPRGDEQLLPQVGDLVWTDVEQAEHSLHHLGAVRAHHLLVDADDVGEKRQRLDLRAHEVNEDLLVEVLVGALGRRRLKRDRGHDQWDELGHFLVDKLLVELVHQHHYDGKLLQDLK